MDFVYKIDHYRSYSSKKYLQTPETCNTCRIKLVKEHTTLVSSSGLHFFFNLMTDQPNTLYETRFWRLLQSV